MRWCADDFGLNDAVSTGILNLIQKKKINSTSCLVTTSCWKNRISDLQPLFNNVEVGLHLTLTRPKPFHLPSSSLGSLMRKSYFGGLNKKDIYREIYSQMEMFKDTAGQWPDYVDGHEFCHHFPTVRETLLDIAEEFHFKENNIYIRVFHPGKISFFKNGIFWIFNHLVSLPSKSLKASLKKKGIGYNSHLLGFHPYNLAPQKYFDYYLQAKPSEKDIFFCHPGLQSDDLSDSLREYRPEVYQFMMSSQFDEMLSRYHIKV